MRCLILDDEPMIVEAAVALLGQFCDVVPVTSSIDALHVVQTQSFDIVITDLNMPDVDGLAICKAARSVNPDVHTILITGMVGGADIDSRDVSLILPKPFSWVKLVSYIQQKVST